MALSDCQKCWDTPCECGWHYRKWPLERRAKLAETILKASEIWQEALLLDESVGLTAMKKWTPDGNIVVSDIKFFNEKKEPL